MKGLIIFISGCLIVSFILSCSSSSNVMVPTLDERSSQEFKDPESLFLVGGPEEIIKDIDLCTIVAGPDVPGYEEREGDIWLEASFEDLENAAFTAGVSIKVVNPNYIVPIYSWLAVVEGKEYYT